MLAKLKAFFDENSSFDAKEVNEEIEAHQRLACAALLIEVAIIDQEFDQSEINAVREILRSKFNIDDTDIEELIRLAKLECEEATSMYQFTQLINQHCTMQNKFELLVGMWQIAYADGELDKYEEYIIRKVADLIHVAHGDFIRAKHQARSMADA